MSLQGQHRQAPMSIVIAKSQVHCTTNLVQLQFVEKITTAHTRNKERDRTVENLC